MKFSIKDFVGKCDQMLSFLRIWPHLLTISLMENFIFCAVEGCSAYFIHTCKTAFTQIIFTLAKVLNLIRVTHSHRYSLMHFWLWELKVLILAELKQAFPKNIYSFRVSGFRVKIKYIFLKNLCFTFRFWYCLYIWHLPVCKSGIGTL